MKLIIRIDDVGYTPVHNLGSWRAIEEGIATSADVMLDTPGTEEALLRLRSYPWISVGWHTHFWGSPVLPAEKVPTLVRGNGHFRQDLSTASDVSEDEALQELHAQLERCIRIYGNVPCCCEFSFSPAVPFGSAMHRVMEEYGIAWGTCSSDPELMPGSDLSQLVPGGTDSKKMQIPPIVAQDKWKDRRIVMANNVSCAAMEDSLADALAYDPVGCFLAHADELLTRNRDEIFFTAWHPGYVDHYVMYDGDQGLFAKNFLLIRPIDVEALCDPRMKKWIEDNKIELVSFADALYDTRNYQNHLRACGSPLAV